MKFLVISGATEKAAEIVAILSTALQGLFPNPELQPPRERLLLQIMHDLV